MMRKALQIVIPTYNRTVQLQETINSVSRLFNSRIGDQICADIFDNSDKNIQIANERIIPKNIGYHKNENNLGYAGNVKRCLSANDAEYIWLISDDDKLNIDNIIFLLDNLNKLPDEVCGVSLNYEVPNIFTGEYDLVSCLMRRDFETEIFQNVLYPDKIPFDFISGFIIKSSVLRRIDILNISDENLYMQSLIYCIALEPTDLIAFFECPLVKWKGDDSLRWPILRLFYDREIIRKILKERHNVVLNNTKLVRSLLKWALLCKIGVVKNASIEKDRKNLFWRVNKSFNLLNYFLSVLLLLPNVFSNKCISIGFSLYGKRTIPRDMLRKFYYKIKNS